ncbi:MAG: ABC transporter permease, partial [Actinobacteria bacterium]|nr:ABC transporter permease [Actinomycetota bacterium]
MSRDLQGFEGTGSLLRLSFRRDRIRIPIWISLLVTIVYVSSRAVADIYPTQASRLAAANAINDSSALLAMFGRIYDPTSIGAIGLVKLIAFGAAGVAVLSGLITIRHSRAEEESGRLDLIGAAVVGRKSALTAALLTSVVTSIALGFMASLALMAADLPVSGSLAFGAAWAGAGIAFAGIAAIAAQISRSSRGATGLLAGSIGVAYLLRALGDSTQRIGWLTWVTPLGWVHHIQPFASEKWWVLALLFGFSVITTGVAFALAARRDLGSGLLADMPGPEEAGTALSTPLALAWRLERTSFIAWTAAFVVLGSVVGGVAGNVGEFLNTETGRQ